MTRRRGGYGGCARCGTRKRGSRPATSQPIANCAECDEPICQRHSVWDSRLNDGAGAYRCTKCHRAKLTKG